MSDEDGAGEFDLLVEKIGKVGEMVSTVKDDTETAVKKAISEQTETIEKRFTDMESRLETVEKMDGGKKKKEDDGNDEDGKDGDGKKKKGKDEDDGVAKLLQEMKDEIKKLKEVPHYKGTVDGQDIAKRQGEAEPKQDRVDLVRMAITGRIDV